MENLDLPYPTPASPKSRTGKWRVFAFHAASSLILGGWGWGFAVPFYFVQDCSYSRFLDIRATAWQGTWLYSVYTILRLEGGGGRERKGLKLSLLLVISALVLSSRPKFTETSNWNCHWNSFRICISITPRNICQCGTEFYKYNKIK